mmetsp:Transcript_44825/g.105119  ORF Transcript_44825/g.105119 Transcript_44825/m.105119 type:complete len:98 (-) Transcript_44825:15-308(-)
MVTAALSRLIQSFFNGSSGSLDGGEATMCGHHVVGLKVRGFVWKTEGGRKALVDHVRVQKRRDTSTARMFDGKIRSEEGEVVVGGWWVMREEKGKAG